MDAICEPVSLYEPVFGDGGESACIMDQIGDTKNGDEQWLEQIALEEAVSRLSPRERRILALRFYDGRTQTEVAREIGISQDADRGRPRDRHLAGAGLAPGKGRDRPHQAGARRVKKGRSFPKTFLFRLRTAHFRSTRLISSAETAPIATPAAVPLRISTGR